MYANAFNGSGRYDAGTKKKGAAASTGHWGQQERPAEVTGLMLDFLRHTDS
jgi:hypothetical protein